MKEWISISLILCTFGFFRELRPNEPFVVEFLSNGVWRNVTSEQLNREIYPFGTYSYLIQLCVVFMITDILRYKPIIIASACVGIVMWALLLWTKTLAWLYAVQICYGFFMASEVAYYTYIYAKVPKEKYQRVTGYTRASLLTGRFLAGVLAQILVSFSLMNVRELNYISFGTQIISFGVSLMLPAVGVSLYMWKIEDSNVEAKDGREVELHTKDIKPKFSWDRASKLLWSHFIVSYSNRTVLIYSIWWALSTAGYLQIISYVQLLWQQIDPNQENFYNGGVEASLTLFGALSASLGGHIFQDSFQKYDLFLLTICSFLQGGLTLVSIWTSNIWCIEQTVVGKEHNTLIFDVKGSNSHQSIKSSNALFVCIAGDSPQREKFEFYVQHTFRYVLGHLLTAFELYEEKRVRFQCQNLLQVARRLLSKIGDLGQLLRGVMAEARELAKAERCSLFLIDKDTGELVSKVFDGTAITQQTKQSKEVRISGTQGIAGHVAQTGKLLNIHNAYHHPLFYKGIDEQTGFKTRNILCFPICDEERVIGVAQLCNKLDGFHFDKCDEETATAFSVYCGISIMHSLVHKRVQKAEARYKLSQELLLYHMKVPELDVANCLNRSTLATVIENFPNFESFDFCPRDVDDHSSIYLCIKMFMDLNFIVDFKMPEEKLARFVMLVQKGYRNMPYHNWQHAFSVTHFSYACMKNLKLIERGIITKLQGLSFLISCLCHDLDHRGFNNSYMTQSGSMLARLYSSEGSINERHHLSQAICILNDPGSKILDSLSTENFMESIDILRELILATDLANHFRIYKDLKKLNAENIQNHQRMLLSLLITCCDLNDQIKTWTTVYRVAELVYTEFFTQGDLEKQMGMSPNLMFDRKKANVPALQIEFLDAVVKPTYEIFVQIFPETSQFLETITENRQHWVEIKEKEETCCKNGNSC